MKWHRTPCGLKTGALLIILVFATILASCSGPKNGERTMLPIDTISADEWKVLSQKRILFGHQSVGNNILSGARSLADGAGAGLKIVESRNAPADTGITHFKIGKNEDPRSKIKDFENTLAGGAAQGADVALMKVCYIDIHADTDAGKLAEEYLASLERLSRQFPRTVFIAVTAPLKTVQSGPKALLKRLMGREIGGYADNFRRQEFNTVLRNSSAFKGRLFDIAKFEAEGAGSHQYKGQALEVLNPALSNDGGHLNARGEQYIAARLLKLLAAVHRPQ
jgi:hypothetical protein